MGPECPSRPKSDIRYHHEQTDVGAASPIGRHVPAGVYCWQCRQMEEASQA